MRFFSSNSASGSGESFQRTPSDPNLPLVSHGSNADDLMGMIDELSNTYNLSGTQWWAPSSKSSTSTIEDVFGIPNQVVNQGKVSDGLASSRSFSANSSTINNYIPVASYERHSTNGSYFSTHGNGNPGQVVSRRMPQQRPQQKREVKDVMTTSSLLKKEDRHEKLRKLLKCKAAPGSVSSSSDTPTQDTILKQLLNEPEEDDDSPGKIYF